MGWFLGDLHRTAVLLPAMTFTFVENPLQRVLKADLCELDRLGGSVVCDACGLSFPIELILNMLWYSQPPTKVLYPLHPGCSCFSKKLLNARATDPGKCFTVFLPSKIQNVRMSVRHFTAGLLFSFHGVCLFNQKMQL